MLFQFAKSTNKLRNTEVQIAKQQEVDAEGNEKFQGGIHSFNDRYYRALYEILLRVHLTKANKLDDFFSLIFKSIKADGNVARVIAFFRRMLHMCFINEVGYTAATLLIISELIKVKDDVRFGLYSFDFARGSSSNKQGAL